MRSVRQNDAQAAGDQEYERQLGHKSARELSRDLGAGARNRGFPGISVSVDSSKAGKEIRRINFAGGLLDVAIRGDLATVLLDPSGAVLTDAVRDIVGATLAAGSNISVTVNADGTITLALTPFIDAALIGIGNVSTTEFGRISTVTSNVQDQLDAKVPLSTGTPTIAAQAAAGSTAAVSILGNDRNGIVTITPGGAGIVAGTQARISFGTARAATNFTVDLTRADLNTGTVDARPTGRTTARWDIWTLAALTSGTAYSFFYTVEDY